MPTTRQNSNKRLRVYKNIFSFFLLLYALSFLMPATKGFKNEGTLYGYEAAFWATITMGDSLESFIGGLSNFISLLLLLFRVIIAFKKGIVPAFMTSSITQFSSSIIATISVGIWLIIWHKPLFFGYYVWAISVIIMCWTNLLQQRLQKTLYDKVQKDKPTIDHLIETI
jgi:hypothetical protein